MHTVADKALRGSDLCARSLVLDIQKEYSDKKAKAIDQRIIHDIQPRQLNIEAMTVFRFFVTLASPKLLRLGKAQIKFGFSLDFS